MGIAGRRLFLVLNLPTSIFCCCRWTFSYGEDAPITEIESPLLIAVRDTAFRFVPLAARGPWDVSANALRTTWDFATRVCACSLRHYPGRFRHRLHHTGIWAPLCFWHGLTSFFPHPKTPIATSAMRPWRAPQSGRAIASALSLDTYYTIH